MVFIEAGAVIVLNLITKNEFFQKFLVTSWFCAKVKTLLFKPETPSEPEVITLVNTVPIEVGKVILKVSNSVTVSENVIFIINPPFELTTIGDTVGVNDKDCNGLGFKLLTKTLHVST